MIIISDSGKMVNFKNVESIELKKTITKKYQIIARTKTQSIVLVTCEDYNMADKAMIAIQNKHSQEDKSTNDPEQNLVYMEDFSYKK